MIQYITTLTQKGQATIPVSIRRKLGLKTGEKVVFEEKGKDVTIKRALNLSELKGSLKSNIKYDDREADKAIAKMFAKKYGKSH